MIRDDVFLVAGNMLSVATGFSGRWRDDVLDSLLFSQLYANSKISKFAGAERWYAEHANAMGEIKWQRSVYKNYSFEPQSDTEIVLSDLIKEKMHSLFGMNYGERFEHLICCVEQSLNAGVVDAALREHSVATVQAEDTEISTFALQVGVVGPGSVLHSAFVCFNTTVDVEVDFLNQRFVGGDIVGKVSVDVSLQLLDKASYERSRMREMIIKQLPDKKDELVLDLSSKCTC